MLEKRKNWHRGRGREEEKNICTKIFSCHQFRCGKIKTGFDLLHLR